MKKLLILLTLSIAFVGCVFAQAYNAAYVHQLYAKYPTVKSDLCSSCKEWVNPYFKSIADTQLHQPKVVYYIYTKEHQNEQIAAKIPRTGVFSAWSPVYGQPDLSKVYYNANKPIKGSINKLVWGHCTAWITLAWCKNAAIFSDTQDFNEGMEVQGQNIGTEIATEEYTRDLLANNTTDSISIWCGTFGNQAEYSFNGITVTMPTHYWKIIEYKVNGELKTEAWLMPNIVTETRAVLPQRVISVTDLIAKIGFNPLTTLN